MNIKVLFFAQLREHFQTDEMQMFLEQGMTVKNLVKRLVGHEESIAHLPLSFAVNETMVSGDTLLNSNDTLALLPPVAGG